MKRVIAERTRNPLLKTDFRVWSLVGEEVYVLYGSLNGMLPALMVVASMWGTNVIANMFVSGLWGGEVSVREYLLLIV